MEPQLILISAIAVITSTILSMVGIYQVRKRVDLSKLRSYHEVAGYLLSVIGTLYAVLLGFMVVDSMNKYDRARVIVEEEGNNIANIFFLAENLPDMQKRNIRLHCLEYINAVLDDEWQTMHHGEASEKAVTAIRDLWLEVIHIEPKTQNQQTLFEMILNDLQNVASNRRLRMITAGIGTSHPLVGVLILGAIIIVVFTYFFGLEDLRTQVIMTGLVTLTLALNLCLVVLFGFPFRMGMPVKPSAFIYDKLIIEREAKRAGVPIQQLQQMQP